MTDNISAQRIHPTAADAYGGIDPLAPPTFVSGAQRQRQRNAETAATDADARMAQITRATTISAEAAQATRPTARPFLRAKPTGRSAGFWGPIRSREVGAFTRVRSRLDGTHEVGQTREAILTAALESGRKREAIPEDLGEQLARVEQRDALTEASRAGLQLAGSMTASRLTKLAKDHRRELYAAAQQDLRDLIADSGQVARALEGVTSAEVAIRLGESAVIAWGAKDSLRERMQAVAESARFVHRATEDGFAFVANRDPDNLAQPGLATERMSATWDLVDNWLEQLNTPDNIVDFLVGR